MNKQSKASGKSAKTDKIQKGAKHTQTAIAMFAAGCFWGVEETFRTLKGVVKTTVGYTGGDDEKPTYEEVCAGGTGHAEALQIVYDPSLVSYGQLLEVFWSNHNPTQLNRQGPDVGDQYRSVIFYHNLAQKKAAEESKKKLEQSGRFSKPIVTQIVSASIFYSAEEYHQHYLEFFDTKQQK